MFNNDEENESWKPNRVKPLHEKAREILDIVSALMDLVPEGDDMLNSVKQMMMEDAMIIPAKIANAEGAGLYDIKMENAAIIRKAAREIFTRCHSLSAFGFEEEEYLPMLRAEIEAFRLLFIDWVASFDPWDYVIDRWGLFNPPGVGPHDKDPDDDIPFDGFKESE